MPALSTSCKIDDLSFDYCRRVLASPRGSTPLTPKESDLLFYLVEHHPEPQTIRDIAQAVWHHRQPTATASYRHVISQLRQKLVKASDCVELAWDRKAGYFLTSKRRIGGPQIGGP